MCKNKIKEKKHTKNKIIKAFVGHELVYKQLLFFFHTTSQEPHQVSVLKLCNQYKLVLEFL